MEALFLKAVNLSITASWLILAVLVLRPALKKAPKWIPCLLWGFVALRLLCPFSIKTAFSLIPSREPLPEDIIYTATPQIQSGISAVDSIVNPALSAAFPANPVASANPTQILSFFLSHIWLIGMVGMILYAMGSYLLLKYRVDTATLLRDNIKQSEQIYSPFVLGFIRPTIYLPYRIAESDIHHVIAHEQAHIRRRDHLWKPVGFLLLSVYWFNPLMWVSYILLCRDIEVACDEKVIKEMEKDDRRAYSTALLNCSIHRRRIAACPLAFGEVSVKDRVKNVMNYKKPAFWVVVPAVLTCSVVAVCLLTDPKPDENDAANNVISSDAADDSTAEPLPSESVETEETSAVQIYWTQPVEDYEVSLRDGTAKNTLEVWVQRGNQKWIIPFSTDNYFQTLDNVSIDTFEDILGYNGFRIHRFATENGRKYYHTDYYAMNEELIGLAYSSGNSENWDTNAHVVDLDGDGINELLCDWSIDGISDVLIFHRHDDITTVCMGTYVMLAENNASAFPEYDSIGAKYLPEKNKILAWYRDERTQEIIEKEYDIDLQKADQWYDDLYKRSEANASDENVSGAAYTAEEAVAILQEQLVLAYENKYGEFIPSDVEPPAYGISDEEYLAYIIPRLEVKRETADYYIIPVIWDFLVDKQTGEVFKYYNGIDPISSAFDPLSEHALSFAG